MQPRLAVLIDAENVGPSHWPTIKKKLNGRTVAIIKLFGNFGEGAIKPWLKIAEENALQPVTQLKGGNAADLAIAVAAMDMLHESKLDGFCFVTSDRDFRPLILRLRGSGLEVLGFGEAKTPQSLRKVYTKFEQLTVDPPVPVNKPKPVLAAAQADKATTIRNAPQSAMLTVAK